MNDPKELLIKYINQQLQASSLALSEAGVQSIHK